MGETTARRGKETSVPLLDHFRPPLYPTHSWESFHRRWAGVIADTLDRVLPRRYFAEVHTHLGTEVSSDVAEFEQAAEPRAATLVLPFVYPDDLEVRVLDEREDARLVAVVELVSPRKKDRPEARRAFAAKGAAYLQRGIGVAVVDLITTRQTNLDNELMDVLRLGEAFRQGEDVSLAALAYRPAHRGGQDQVDVWAVPLQVGGTLPVLPLALRGAGPVPLDLEATYTEVRQRCRL
jgi:hypothetical protein